MTHQALTTYRALLDAAAVAPYEFFSVWSSRAADDGHASHVSIPTGQNSTMRLANCRERLQEMAEKVRTHWALFGGGPKPAELKPKARRAPAWSARMMSVWSAALEEGHQEDILRTALQHMGGRVYQSEGRAAFLLFAPQPVEGLPEQLQSWRRDDGLYVVAEVHTGHAVDNIGRHSRRDSERRALVHWESIAPDVRSARLASCAQNCHASGRAADPREALAAWCKARGIDEAPELVAAVAVVAPVLDQAQPVPEVAPTFDQAQPVPDDGPAFLRAAGFAETGPGPGEWVHPVSPLGDVIARIVGTPGAALRVEISADYMGRRFASRVAEGPAAIRAAVEWAAAGLHQARGRISARIRAHDAAGAGPGPGPWRSRLQTPGARHHPQSPYKALHHSALLCLTGATPSTPGAGLQPGIPGLSGSPCRAPRAPWGPGLANHGQGCSRPARARESTGQGMARGLQPGPGRGQDQARARACTGPELAPHHHPGQQARAWCRARPHRGPGRQDGRRRAPGARGGVRRRPPLGVAASADGVRTPTPLGVAASADVRQHGPPRPENLRLSRARASPFHFSPCPFHFSPCPFHFPAGAFRSILTRRLTHEHQAPAL